MKLDLTKLPVGEMLIGFLMAALVVTFVGAFMATDSGTGKEAPPASATPGASPSPGASPTGGGLAVTMRDNKFEPSELTVAAGSTVTINLTNSGTATHNMHIAGTGNKYGVSFCEPGGAEPCSDPNIVAGSSTATLAWKVPATSGKIDFRCDFHPTEMKGTITIQ